MMKAICLWLALVAIAYCANDNGGFAAIKTPSNGDPGSCILTLTVTVQKAALNFKAVQSAQAPPNQDCTHQDLQLDNLYRNAPTKPLTIALVPKANNPNILTGKLKKADFNSQLGFGCVNVGAFAGLTWLKCRFKYASIYFSVDWFALANGDYDQSWVNIMYPMQAQTVGNSGDVLKANNSYQTLVGMTWENCGQWDSVINNLNSNITVTGTQYQSNNYNLAADLSGLHLYAIIVRNNAGTVKVWQPAAPYKPFTSLPANYCWNLGVKYNAVLQGLSCSGGCFMTLLLYSQNAPGKAFDLMTQGFTTTSRLRA